MYLFSLCPNEIGGVISGSFPEGIVFVCIVVLFTCEIIPVAPHQNAGGSDADRANNIVTHHLEMDSINTEPGMSYQRHKVCLVKMMQHV